MVDRQGSGFDTAQICINGHVVNSQLADFPAKNEDYCSKCGAKTIVVCPKCEVAIRGVNYLYGHASTYSRPAYCFKCGAPYPWTEEALKAASEFTKDLDELSPADKASLMETFPDLVRDSPQSTVAASRFARMMAKVGPLAAEGLKTILVNVVTEMAKKTMFPGGV